MIVCEDNVTNFIINRPSSFQESGGLVVMEAENYDANDMRSDPNDYSWQLNSSTGGYIGDDYVETPLPQGTNATWGNACELTYRINFVTTGTYHIWLRRYATDGATNSGYVGMNSTQAGGYDNGGNYDSWVWKKMGTASVSSSGERTFNLRRREAGYQVDRILMTTEADYTPSGAGPNESPRGVSSLDNIPWNEGFSLPDGTTTDAAPTGWTSTRGGTFEVNSNRFMITGSGGEGVWESKAIDISADDIDISLDWQGVGSLDPATLGYGDYIRAYYQVDGGSDVLIAEKVNGEEFSMETITEKDISGNILKIIIRAKTTGDDEYYYIDNVSIKSPDSF
jgi:hypothetical protein